ncbi:MAG TPA: response regulator transcription factor [Rhodocyclaceae bacterium]
MRVIVADDHTLFRAGLLRMLSDFPDIQVVAEASTGDETLAAAQAVAADLLILDLVMPGPTGVPLIERLKREQPDLPILVLTMHDEPATVRRTLQSGALGFITKDADPDTLLAAITSVAQRTPYVAPALAVRLVMHSDERKPASPAAPLSKREEEVMELIAEGLALNQIAKRLSVSPKTVTSHKANLMEKLGLKTNADLIRYVLERSSNR